jgi:hypothetical protein
MTNTKIAFIYINPQTNNVEVWVYSDPNSTKKRIYVPTLPSLKRWEKVINSGKYGVCTRLFPGFIIVEVIYDRSGKNNQ